MMGVQGGTEVKIRIAVSQEREQAVAEALLRAGFELDDEAELVVLENDQFARHLAVRDKDGNRLHLAVEEIVFIEALGHSVLVHGMDGVYQTADRLYQLCLMLDPKQFCASATPSSSSATGSKRFCLRCR